MTGIFKQPNRQEVEENIVLSVFPLEIWLQIFQQEHLNNFAEIYICTPAFVKILFPLRAKLLFGKVLESVIRYLRSECNIRYKETSQLLLTCRATCLSWRNSVDDILQNESRYPVTIGETTLIREELVFMGIYYSFQTTLISTMSRQPTLAVFKNHFTDTHLSVNRNPFVSRAVKLTFVCSPEAPEHKAELDELLPKIGHHIWFCSLQVFECAPSGNYAEYRQLFDLLPNLKTINIHHSLGYLKHYQKQVCEIQPFQTMPKLQCVRDFGEKSAAIIEALVEQNLHIQVLQMNDFQIADDSVILRETMPNLQELKINFANLCDVWQLGKLPPANWALKKLILILRQIKTGVHWREVGKLFQLLERKFGNTLQELELSLPYRIYNSPKPYSLDLPHLKTLTLRMPFAQSIDFLLPLRSRLERLTVWASYPLNELNIEEETIKFFFHAKNNTLSSSNIWTVFAKLQQLKWCEKTFKRVGNHVTLLKQTDYGCFPICKKEY